MGAAENAAVVVAAAAAAAAMYPAAPVFYMAAAAVALARAAAGAAAVAAAADQAVGNPAHQTAASCHACTPHRMHVFKAFIHGELVRYVVTNTCAADYDRMSAVFWQRLRARGYPPAFLQPLFAAVSHSNRQQYLQQAVRQTAAQANASAAPVLVMTNGRVERQCMNLGQVVNNVLQQYSHVPELQALFGDRVVVAYRNPPSLRKMLVKAKH
jgi:hypothetical protein